jgi:AbrB family looped-hinge helix DNA binding protein
MTHLIRISSRGRITIPKHLRDKFGWGHGAKVNWLVDGDGVIITSSGNAPISEESKGSK